MIYSVCAHLLEVHVFFFFIISKVLMHSFFFFLIWFYISSYLLCMNNVIHGICVPRGGGGLT